ncbi:MAG: Gfo/Idh/MocA family oxidoreductase [Chloroflexota bacterium]
MKNIAVIGYGYWGPNIVRNFVELPTSQVVTISDINQKQLTRAKERYPGVKVTPNNREIFDDPTIDAVAIATPVSTHFDLAVQALEAGKHVLVEKPLTATSEQAIRLINKAKGLGLVLMVDHTFIYTGAVRKIKELIADNELGEIYYYDSVRVNLGLFQHDINVIWDLAVHDLSIMDFVLATQPQSVSATGISHVSGEPENIAYLTLFFENNLIAHIHINWLAPVKVRRTLIGGSSRMIVYDDLEPSEKVKVYDKGITVNESRESIYRMLIGYRTGDMWAPQLNMTEALRTEALHFIQCIEGNEHPITDGEAGLRVVRILEAATKSLAERGQLVEISTTGVIG